MFLCRNKKNNVYPVIPSFTIQKWGLRGSKLYRRVFVMIFTGHIFDSQGCKNIHADNEDSDQTAQMRRLICVFVGRICQKVRFLT